MDKTIILLMVIMTGSCTMYAHQKYARVNEVDNDADVQQVQAALINNAQLMPLQPYVTTQTSEFITAMTVILLFLNSVKDNKLSSLIEDSHSLQSLTKTILFLAVAGCILKVGLDCSAGFVHFLSRMVSKGITNVQRSIDHLLYGKERFNVQQLLIWEYIFDNTTHIIGTVTHEQVAQHDADLDWEFVQQVVDTVFSRIVMYIECALPYYQKSVVRRHVSCIDNDATVIFIAALLINNINHLKKLVSQAATLQIVQTEHCKKIIEHSKELFKELRYVLADPTSEQTYVVEVPVMQETLQAVAGINGIV